MLPVPEGHRPERPGHGARVRALLGPHVAAVPSCSSFLPHSHLASPFTPLAPNPMLWLQVVCVRGGVTTCTSLSIGSKAHGSLDSREGNYYWYLFLCSPMNSPCRALAARGCGSSCWVSTCVCRHRQHAAPGLLGTPGTSCTQCPASPSPPSVTHWDGITAAPQGQVLP